VKEGTGVRICEERGGERAPKKKEQGCHSTWKSGKPGKVMEFSYTLKSHGKVMEFQGTSGKKSLLTNFSFFFKSRSKRKSKGTG
jgi:hypothetical protein